MKYLFFISQNYSFEILRPIQKLAREQGHEVLWMVFLDRVNTSLFRADENYSRDVTEVMRYKPDAVFVPGNIVPSFIPGLKVEVFHGFEWKKKGHFKIRNCFDLYCTQGPFFTDGFKALQAGRDFFDVVETGWSKLDPLFSAPPMTRRNSELPCVLYAPTFSPSLTSAPDLIEEINRLSQAQDWHWIVKFHPKMPQAQIDAFKRIQHDKLEVVDVGEISSLLQTADVIVSDTSSIITEFLLLNKPAVTYKNAQPEPVLIDIQSPSLLEAAITSALDANPERQALISDYAAKMHPYSDGQSAQRILSAVEQRIKQGKDAKGRLPSNIFRNLKMRKKLSYWRFFNG